ncbi:MAG TPA: hypothetical protein VFS83_08505 [Ktedonobacterales bacterium]|nr:hypothetical protein [Ktedonobacterales bacterium]
MRFYCGDAKGGRGKQHCYFGDSVTCQELPLVFSERLERKTWLPIGAVITLIGGVMIALAGHAASPTEIPWVAFIGAVILFFGFNVWAPMTYTWSTGNFPTRAHDGICAL